VSTIDDYLAFGQMMLNEGRHGSQRILSRPSVEAMTTDRLTPAQKAVSDVAPSFAPDVCVDFWTSAKQTIDD
jgi:CubicO group peptidase (beta-lactamase class C family)